MVVLGGGFGGLETAFSLRMLAGERAKITPVSEQRSFLFKPSSIPFDFLVIATGTDMRATEIPKLAEHAISTWTPVDMLKLRAGKKTLGFSVPWRFGRGEPFHGGNFWRGMDAGLRAMSGVLAK